MPSAIKEEKQIKEWKRQWKLELIEGMNPDWKQTFMPTSYNQHTTGYRLSPV